MNKNKKVILLAQGAMIAAAYAAATWLSAVFGIAYGAVQFRFSEALTVSMAGSSIKDGMTSPSSPGRSQRQPSS